MSLETATDVIQSPKLRVAFTGGQGSGKTTLCEYLINKYKFKYAYINRTRKLINESYKGDLSLARQDNLAFQKALMNKKIYWEKRHVKTGFISDRTSLDNIAYFLGFSNDLPKEVVLEYVYKGIKHAKENYDLIICLPPILDTPDDPLSPPDTINKFKIYYTVLGLLTVIEAACPNVVKYIYIQDLEQRKSLVDNYLNEKLGDDIWKRLLERKELLER